MANAQFADIGKAFVQHYYKEFDSNRINLQQLYKEPSMLTFENEQFMGMQTIMQKLTVSLTIRKLCTALSCSALSPACAAAATVAATTAVTSPHPHPLPSPTNLMNPLPRPHTLVVPPAAPPVA